MLGGPLDRADDGRVAGAAADLAGDRLADLAARSGRGCGRAAPGRSSSSPACRSRTAGRGSCMKPCCTGSSSPSCSRPSTVRTSWPPAIAASTVQDFTGSPSSQTTQVPQLLVSQPQCVPVRPRWSRRKCTSSMRPSISRVTSLAVDGHRHLHVSCSSSWSPAVRSTARRSARRVSSSARCRLYSALPRMSVDRAAALGGDRAGLRVQLLGRRLAAQRLGDRRDAGGVRARPRPARPGRR